MNGASNDLGHGTTRNIINCCHEVSTTDSARRSLAPNALELPGSPEVTIEENQLASEMSCDGTCNELGSGTPTVNDSDSSECKTPLNGVSLGPDPSKHSGFVNKSFCGEPIPAILKIPELVRMLNNFTLGEVISERQLRRQCEAFPEVKAGRGKIHLLLYIAVLCSRRRRGVRNGRRCDTLSLSDLQELLQKQNYRCALTGVRLQPENTALDHILPISEGGSFSIDNSQLVTKSVNRAKNTMREDEFVRMCHRIAATRKCVKKAE